MKKIKSFLMSITLITIFTLVGCRPGTVTNPATGKTWMDRNLGASQVATSSTDAAAFGDLYQWGRAADGHESRTSGTTNTKATTAVPGGGNSWDGLFIITGIPHDPLTPQPDWLTPYDNTLWQGASGTNNPCPTGFRLPTQAEWEEERLSWATNDAAGAFGSPLKLTFGGARTFEDGLLNNTDGLGYYWSSSHHDKPGVSSLHFSSISARIVGSGRAYGFSVRCIKD